MTLGATPNNDSLARREIISITISQQHKRILKRWQEEGRLTRSAVIEKLIENTCDHHLWPWGFGHVFDRRPLKQFRAEEGANGA